jgi:hypothetical protein
MCSKKIKDMYVSQCGAIVRDNVLISYREWKGKADNPHVVSDSVKNLLWDEILKHFTLLEGVEPANVKRWTLTRMTTQFQKFKQQLDKDYIKKNRTPNWIEYPKLKEHRTSIVEYKKSGDFAKASARGKKSRGNKEHDHHLGRGGYAFAIPKWRKMEQDILAQGTITAVVDWSERVKNWYYAHEAQLTPKMVPLITHPRYKRLHLKY